MPSFSIRLRLLLLISVPTVLGSCLLGGLMLNHHLTALAEMQVARGWIAAQQVAGDIRAVDILHNSARLDALLPAALEQPDVRSVSMYDADRALLAHSGPLPRAPTNGGMRTLFADHATVTRTDASWRLVVPFTESKSVSVPMSGNVLPASGRINGWIEIEVSDQTLRAARYRAIAIAIAVLLAIVLTQGIASHLFSDRILSALGAIANGMRRVANGQLGTRLPNPSPGELGQLQQNFNDMCEALQHAQEDLQHSVSQATEDLRETLETIEVQNIELEMARKEAVQGARLKSEFLANMSHEIRTPLNGMIGFTRLLLKTELNPRQAEYLTTIRKSSDALLTIINDILDFSKIEAGKLALDRSPVDIRDIVDDVLALMAPLAAEKRLEQVAFVYQDTPRRVITDPIRLRQILTNLLSNAIKFTEHGMIVVRVMLDSENERQATLRFAVSDTGVGLSIEQQSTLFTAFTQVDASVRRQAGGTGLGLAICKHLVELMGGEVGLESATGEGSTFWFTIRADIDHFANRTKSDGLAGLRIVVCDTNDISRLALRHLIEEWGARVIEAELPEEVLSCTAEHTDAVLLGSGPRPGDAMTHARLAEQCIARGIRVWLLPGTGDDSANTLSGHWFGGIIAKPVSTQRLHDALVGQLGTPVAGESCGGSHSPGLERLHVLVVDDNEANLRLLCTLIEDLGISVKGVTNGLAAISALRNGHYDLVFMDIQMPGMDGVETTRRIRELGPAHTGTPVIAVTAHALASERQQLLGAGLDDYLTKPIGEQQLCYVLERWAGVRFTNSPLPAAHPLPGNESGVVDLDASLALAGGKPSLGRDMLRMLANSLADDLRDIPLLASQRDADGLLARVHKLHGATRYVGTPGLRQAANELETAIKSARERGT
ncbi:MAG: response regulator, partial [Pseudomonadota bacterium]